MVFLRLELHGPGNLSDALEESYVIAKRVHVPVAFEYRGRQFEVFPNWSRADEIAEGHRVETYHREGARDWVKANR